MLLTNLLLVGLGGFAGAVLRFTVGSWVEGMMNGSPYPVATLLVNMAGCFLIGLLGGLAEGQDLLSHQQRLLLMTGLLGAFTTYSTFSLETLGLFGQGQFGPAVANVGIHVVLGLAAVWLGAALVKMA